MFATPRLIDPYNDALPLEDRPPYRYKTGAVYTGQWKGGFRSGYGEIKWPDGATYKGGWKDNRAHGRGKFVHVDGDVYEGEWAYDKANGFGKYTHRNGATYEGYWKEDVQHGQGKETWADGAKYEGEYSYGKKHGKGAYVWSDGSKYTGDWDDNNISGKVRSTDNSCKGSVRMERRAEICGRVEEQQHERVWRVHVARGTTIRGFLPQRPEGRIREVRMERRTAV